MRWVALFLIILVQCRFYDYRQEALTGTTFQERNWERKTKQDIFFFSSKFKDLPKGEEISFRKLEYSLIPGYFGNMLGNTFYRDNFSEYFPLGKYKEKLTEGKYIIIHNIRIKYNSNVIFDGFKTYSVLMVGYYNIEAELNFISEEEFEIKLANKGKSN